MQSKPVTLKEIAQLLNISVSSVSRALHDHPSIGLLTRQKVTKLAAELNYQPNQNAIFLQKGCTHTIGVILPELSETFFSSAITAIEDAALKHNYNILFAQSHNDTVVEKQLIEKMKHQRVDGLLISVSKDTTCCHHFEDLNKHNIPIVFFDRRPLIQNIHYVTCDLELGTIDAVCYLLKKGHRSIGMINGPMTLLASVERRQGYIKAFTKYRLKFDPSLIVSSDLTETGTQMALRKLLSNKRRPTAIVTFNDYVAIFAIKEARTLNIIINKDLEFVSYANLPLINHMENGPTASVEQFPYEQGQKATEILLDLMSYKTRQNSYAASYYQIIIKAQLIENSARITNI